MWDELPVPDVMFMLNPHVESFKESCNIYNFPMKMLITYVPYGLNSYGRVDDQYNQISQLLCWKIFHARDIDMDLCRKYSELGDRNALVSGYPKMDGFYDKEMPDDGKIWKIPEGKPNAKKIIYAPHWSIRGAVTGFGNFDKIYDWIYEYAKNHADTTSWIFRPHPLLRSAVVQYGLFGTENDYDRYVKKWDELPNARVVENGEYIDIFRTSDAMVLDSISFLTEYQFTHKPLLFLTRETNTWNEFGEELIKILYTAPGEDTDAIERFIEDVVVNGNDPMKPEREALFDKYLDYRARNGKLACEYVKDFLDETFGK
jgi:CDP-glycerol glycerophosphotransferase (TagB/SpsB family)